MDKLLVDTNVVLDLLGKRIEFCHEAQELFTLSDHGKIQLCVSSLTIANTHYILTRQLKIADARKILRQFKVLVEVLPLHDKILELSLDSNFRDFEDAIQYYSALEGKSDMIITRNKKGFKFARIPVLTAREYLSLKR
ncbi:MAG: PIN domain nuclease [Bacteroidetes bacterium]|nr:MAG: PIN domain nuclease [Bacteroidota bacterium]